MNEIANGELRCTKLLGNYENRSKTNHGIPKAVRRAEERLVLSRIEHKSS